MCLLSDASQLVCANQATGNRQPAFGKLAHSFWWGFGRIYRIMILVLFFRSHSLQKNVHILHGRGCFCKITSYCQCYILFFFFVCLNFKAIKMFIVQFCSVNVVACCCPLLADVSSASSSQSTKWLRNRKKGCNSYAANANCFDSNIRYIYIYFIGHIRCAAHKINSFSNNFIRKNKHCKKFCKGEFTGVHSVVKKAVAFNVC